MGLPKDQYACNHRLIDKLATELDWPEHAGHIWTRELCFQEAKKFKWLSDWVKGSPASYGSAHKQGWLAEIKSKMFTKKPVLVHWTQEACAARARVFESRNAWQYQCRDGSYTAARRNGWLAEIARQFYGQRINRWSTRVVMA